MVRSDNIKGKRLRQNTLQTDFQNKAAGQTRLNKFILLTFSLILFGISGLLCGLLGSLTSLQIITTKGTLPYSLMVITLGIVFTNVISFKLKKLLISIILYTFLAAMLLLFLNQLNILGYSLNSFSVTLAVTIFGLAFTLISFGVTRFSIALIDVLLKRAEPLRILGVFVGLLGALAGAWLESSLEKSYPTFREALRSENLQFLVIFCGIILALLVFASGFLANHIHRIPWKYPGFLRYLAILFGSLGGTSFRNIDLSGVNFKGSELANSDLRARQLYRVCFQDTTGLERARVDNQYLDLENPKVQMLLVKGCSPDPIFCKFNLQGAYLQNADMRGFDLTDTNLTGADLKSADLRGSILIRTQLAGVDFQGVDLRKNVLIDANLTEANLRNSDLRECILVRAQVARADFTGADLTGACIEDWSVSDKTTFTEVRCDYVFKKYEDGQPTHRYPFDRNFEPGEFAALFQQPENELELIFKGDFSYSALSLAFYKLKTEKPELDLELKGIEQRGNLWVVRVTSINPTVEAQLEQQFSEVYQNTTNSDSLERLCCMIRKTTRPALRSSWY
ncbi:pentapeptide repeat-containing protein [Pantanalinema rosaneae CENA516]|uniref:pentapeptide repeat-containing protein n=1 Tax=Pantanalinema rosaneae TaxID=1620701 RepID=UPI003D6E82A2